MVFPSFPAAYYNLHLSNWQLPQLHPQEEQNPPTLFHGSNNNNNPNPPPASGPRGSRRRSITMSERALQENVRRPEGSLECPRCGSHNTKFCYYNNYSLSQPRYKCRNCLRHWTQGGSLRQIPTGGNKRRSKPSSSSRAAARSSSSAMSAPGLNITNYYNDGTNYDIQQWRNMTQIMGGFGSAAPELLQFEDEQIMQASSGFHNEFDHM